MAEDDIRQKMRIQYALKEREARIACHIVEMCTAMADMLDCQSPSVLEGVIDYAKDLQKPDSKAPKHRKQLREALIKYGEQALKEQRKTERLLLQGITGETVKDNDTR